MQNTGTNRNIDKRSGTDRRAGAIGLDFPFIDSHGNLVTEDRRKANRRKEHTLDKNISVNQQKNYA